MRLIAWTETTLLVVIAHGLAPGTAGYNHHRVTVGGFSISLFEANLQTQEQLVEKALSDHVSLDGPEADPYGTVLWPAAVPVADRVVDLVRSEAVNQIFEIGAGTGLVSLAACAAGASKVVATDYNPLTLAILDNGATQNFGANHCIKTQLFDVTDANERLPQDWGSGALLACADLLYTPSTSRAVARRCAEALRMNWRVVIGDCGRPGAGAFLAEMAELLGQPAAFHPVDAFTVAGPRNDLIAAEHEVKKRISVGMIELGGS